MLSKRVSIDRTGRFDGARVDVDKGGRVGS